MSINPDKLCARTSGTPAMAVGSSTPFRKIRRRPGRSVIRMRPSGKNAMLKGWLSPLVMNSLTLRWTPVSRTIGPAGSGGDGQVIPAELVNPRAPVYVRFDKLAGQVQYAGAAPTLVNGALQVNVVVPRDVVGGGQVPVRLVVGGFSSAPGTTIWVK